MKKGILSLVLTLALALSLGLCAGASAAEASLSGVLGNESKLSWTIDGGVLRVDAGQGWTGSVFAACYNNKGRLTEVKVLTPEHSSASVSPWVTRAKLFWTGEGLAPKCEPTQARLAPDRVITQGVEYWSELTNPAKANYVAPAFAEDCVYTLNGAAVDLSAVRAAAAKQGAVKQFELNDDGLISSVTCYDYTVRQVDGKVSLCYTTPDGVSVIEPVTGKITGKVAAFSTGGGLLINGVQYKATGLTVAGCDLKISQKAFRNWTWDNLADLSSLYDFYLDKSGAICWAEQLTDGNPSFCVPLSAWQEGDGVRVKLLDFSGHPYFVTITQFNSRPITDPAAVVALLRQDVRNWFYTRQTLAHGGFDLVRVGTSTGEAWTDTVPIPAGTNVSNTSDFTGGAIGLTADDGTTFLVATNTAEGQAYRRYLPHLTPLPDLENVRGFAVAKADDPGVADHVYLEAGDYFVTPPKGCVFIVDNDFLLPDPEELEDTFRVSVVGPFGDETFRPISPALKEDLSGDSMEIGWFANNRYVGRFCAITEMNCDGVVSALEPMEASPLLALSEHDITTLAGTWEYDDHTRFVRVDLGWKDNPDDPDNQPHVRENTDLVTLISSYHFTSGPYHTIDEEAAARLSLEAVVLAPEGSNIADYVYIVDTQYAQSVAAP